MTDDMLYQVLNRCMPDYKIVERIGSGNFGSVYKCERDGIYYAIKVISVPANENELQTLLERSGKDEVDSYLDGKVEKYRKEIKLMAELKGNRSIVNIEDYQTLITENGMRYIVIRMELLTSLRFYSSKHGMDEKEVIRLGIDICDALSICEKHDVIHRDVKPENIMRHSEGTFKLGDFGVAKQLSKTTAGTIAGTEGFMAPEVYRGQEYNHTADIYSLGIVLYYYLNNEKMPYVAPNDKSLIAEQEAIERRMNDKTPLPPPPKAGDTIGKIIIKACMFDKENRYQSAVDLRNDLMKALRGEPVEVNLESNHVKGTIIQTKNMQETKTYQSESTNETPFQGEIVDTTAKQRASNDSMVTEEFDKANKKTKKKTVTGIITAVCILAVFGVGGFFAVKYFFSDQESGMYLNENGELVEVLSKSDMEDAYNLGVQYAEQGNYEEAIEELNKVTEKSRKYEDAQAALLVAMESYKNTIIEKANGYSGNGDYDTALTLLDTGIASLGQNPDFITAKDDILKSLKADFIGKADTCEKNEDYKNALLNVQTALTYLPDDYELKGLYSRLDATNTADVALKDAEKYRYEGDYSKLFSSLEKVMDSVSASTTASSKVKMAYETYKKEYLDSIEELTKNPGTVAEYDAAIAALETATTIFDEEYDLKSQQRDLNDMRTAVKAVTDADTYAGQDDYLNLFSTLTGAMETLGVSTEAGKYVQASYDKYEKSYLEELNQTIGKPKTVSEYNTAIRALELAVTVFPENMELQTQLQTLNKTKPVNLFSQNVVDAKWRYPNYDNDWRALDINNTDYVKCNVEAEDNYGTKYDSATIMYIGEGWYQSSDTYVSFDCADYKKLTGKVAITNSSKSYTGHMAFKIKGYTDEMMEKVLYDETFSSGMRPQNISVNLSNYSLVKVEIYTNNSKSSAWASLILSDFTLSN